MIIIIIDIFTYKLILINHLTLIFRFFEKNIKCQFINSFYELSISTNFIAN